MHRFKGMMVLALLVGVSLGGCATAPGSEADRQQLGRDVRTTIIRFEQRDPGIADLLDRAYGYAVFPSIGKGAVGIGGAYGRGQAFEQGTLIGYCDMTQATIGFALGGQSYSELIFFEDAAALDRFKYNNLEFSAQASAVAATAGASATADYSNGVLVFTMPKAGLMYEASIGGQGFTYEPLPRKNKQEVIR